MYSIRLLKYKLYTNGGGLREIQNDRERESERDEEGRKEGRKEQGSKNSTVHQTLGRGGVRLLAFTIADNGRKRDMICSTYILH